MCEIEKQLNELLAGTKPTQTTKALKIEAMYIDKKFANIEDKLDLILDKIDENKLETDRQLSKIRDEQAQNCVRHKTDLNNRLNELDEKNGDCRFLHQTSEVVNYSWYRSCISDWLCVWVRKNNGFIKIRIK